MAAFIQVTDSLTGEPVAVNVDQIQSIKRIGRDEATLIDFGKNFVQCKENLGVVESKIIKAITTPLH